MAVDTPLMAAGLDSIAAGELANTLAGKFAVALPQTVLFDHPTIGAVASFVGATVVTASCCPSGEDQPADVARQHNHMISPVPGEQRTRPAV